MQDTTSTWLPTHRSGIALLHHGSGISLSIIKQGVGHGHRACLWRNLLPPLYLTLPHQTGAMTPRLPTMENITSLTMIVLVSMSFRMESSQPIKASLGKEPLQGLAAVNQAIMIPMVRKVLLLHRTRSLQEMATVPFVSITRKRARSLPASQLEGICEPTR